MVANADFARAGFADLDLDDLQFLGTAIAIDANGFAAGHGFPLLRMGMHESCTS
jgi:hypothetical protein